MPFAPAIACFVVRKWITREGFGDAGLRLNLRNGASPDSSLGPSMLGEALALVGIVVTDNLWRRRFGKVPVREASAVQTVAVGS